MKRLSVLTICCFSMVAQAGFNMRVPLEIKENGRLPDGSIVFINSNNPTTPTIPEEEPSDCVADVMSGTYYYIQEASGESMIFKAFNGQRISNGTRGKLVDGSAETYGIPIYELCMNGQLQNLMWNLRRHGLTVNASTILWEKLHKDIGLKLTMLIYKERRHFKMLA